MKTQSEKVLNLRSFHTTYARTEKESSEKSDNKKHALVVKKVSDDSVDDLPTIQEYENSPAKEII